jgi:hypothetical protein
MCARALALLLGQMAPRRASAAPMSRSQRVRLALVGWAALCACLLAMVRLGAL